MKQVMSALVCMFVGAVPASAKMISFDATSVADDDTAIDLQQFDPSQGTLNSVLLEVNGTLEGVYRIDTACASRCERDDEGSVRLDIQYFGGRLHTGLGTVDFGCIDGTPCVATGSAIEEAMVSEMLGPDAGFIGLGTFEIEARAANRSEALVELVSLENSVFARVTYDFTPIAAVPLPATLPLALFALGGLGAIRRKA